MKKFLVALLLTFISASSHAAAGNVSATYKFIKNGQLVGMTTEKFVRTGDKYRIESETKAAGILAMFSKQTILLLSRGTINKDGLRPEHFEHHPGKDKSKDVYADFDWATGMATLKRDGNTETKKIEPGLQDRISLMYQFMFLKKIPAELSLNMTNGKSIEQYIYKLVGKEKITTPAGTFNTLHLRRVPQTEDEDTVDLWLATSRKNFPVRIIFEEKNHQKLEQLLTDLKIE
jgi:hypothetical protein